MLVRRGETAAVAQKLKNCILQSVDLRPARNVYRERFGDLPPSCACAMHLFAPRTAPPADLYMIFLIFLRTRDTREIILLCTVRNASFHAALTSYNTARWGLSPPRFFARAASLQMFDETQAYNKFDMQGGSRVLRESTNDPSKRYIHSLDYVQ